MIGLVSYCLNLHLPWATEMNGGPRPPVSQVCQEVRGRKVLAVGLYFLEMMKRREDEKDEPCTHRCKGRLAHVDLVKGSGVGRVWEDLA